MRELVPLQFCPGKSCRLTHFLIQRVGSWGHSIGAAAMPAVASHFGQLARVLTIRAAIFVTFRCWAITRRMFTFGHQKVSAPSLNLSGSYAAFAHAVGL